MVNNDDFLKVLAKNVTLQYPKLQQTHRFNTAQQKSEPCAQTANGAAWSIGFEMTKEEARPLFEEMKKHYENSKSRNTKLPAFKTVFGMKKLKDEHGNETGIVQFTAKRSGVKKDGAHNKPPTVIDGQKQPLADLNIWGGSKGSVRAWAVAVVDPDGFGGISLLLDAVQVTEARYGDGGMDDFDEVQSKSDPFETKPLTQEKRQAIKQEMDDEIPF